MITNKNFLSKILVAATIVLSPLLLIAPARAEDKRPIEVTFTKWITTYPLMAGVVGGDVRAVFAGEILQRQVSADGRIIRLEAIYEAKAGRQSFTALIRGGESNETGSAILDGVILAGWQTGSQVHVKFEAMTNCAGAPPGNCFVGTIHITPNGDKD